MCTDCALFVHHFAIVFRSINLSSSFSIEYYIIYGIFVHKYRQFISSFFHKHRFILPYFILFYFIRIQSYRKRSNPVLTAIRSREERADYGYVRAPHDAHVHRMGEGCVTISHERTFCHAGTYSLSYSLILLFSYSLTLPLKKYGVYIHLIYTTSRHHHCVTFVHTLVIHTNSALRKTVNLNHRVTNTDFFAVTYAHLYLRYPFILFSLTDLTMSLLSSCSSDAPIPPY